MLSTGNLKLSHSNNLSRATWLHNYKHNFRALVRFKSSIIE
jgi:hypothetical protein